MKKKIVKYSLAVLVITFFVVVATACDSGSGEEKNQIFDGHFTVIETYSDFGRNVYKVYDNDTKVVYLILKESRGVEMTVLYNADGTVQTYEGDSEE